MSARSTKVELSPVHGYSLFVTPPSVHSTMGGRQTSRGMRMKVQLWIFVRHLPSSFCCPNVNSTSKSLQLHATLSKSYAMETLSTWSTGNEELSHLQKEWIVKHYRRYVLFGVCQVAPATSRRVGATSATNSQHNNNHHCS